MSSFTRFMFDQSESIVGMSFVFCERDQRLRTDGQGGKLFINNCYRNAVMFLIMSFVVIMAIKI